MPQAAAQRCAFHDQRAAFALCMSCRKHLCQECATQWDGIWHCTPCLAAKRSSAKGGSSIIGWFIMAGACAALFFLSIRAMVWSGALLAGLR